MMAADKRHMRQFPGEVCSKLTNKNLKKLQNAESIVVNVG